MLAVTTGAGLGGNVGAAFMRLARDPWGLATLFDAYFAFLMVWGWIAWREGTWIRRLTWLGAILLLGNFALAAYALLALRKAKGVDELFQRT